MQRQRWTRSTAVLAAALVGVAGCSGGAPSAGTSSTLTAGHAPRQAPPQVAGGHSDEDFEHEPPAPVPTWDEQAKAAALKFAGTVMEGYARPTVSAGRWFEDLEPFLTQPAAGAYVGTDPASIPASMVTGPPSLATSSSPYVAQVLVPTNAGEYTVLLARTGAQAPWRVERITPPSERG